MLAGPKVSRVLPFLQQRGFVGDAFNNGAQALAHLRRAPCHVLIIELELGDMMGIDLARTGKQEGIVGATLLLEDPIKSGMVISALARGIEAYVPVPPDETVFLERIETLLLAQWGLVVTAQQQQLTDEVARLTADLERERGRARQAGDQLAQQRKQAAHELAEEHSKVSELEFEIASLRDQLTTMHLVTGAKSGASDEGRAEGRADAAAIDDMEAAFGTADDDAAFDQPTVTIEAAAMAKVRASEKATRHGAPSPTVGATRAAGAARADPGPPGVGLDGQGLDTPDQFDFENENTPAAGAPQVPASQRFGDNDENTAPGGHSPPSMAGGKPQPGSPKTPRKSNATTANLDSEMLRDLARIATAAEEEVIFVEDD